MHACVLLSPCMCMHDCVLLSRTSTERDGPYIQVHSSTETQNFDERKNKRKKKMERGGDDLGFFSYEFDAFLFFPQLPSSLTIFSSFVIF
mmetsp:Transcript_48538/g.95757  ORF Transcript_48538/g.95757 Transcript_48538/m.95757 type:complete len:90 (+) Transcript_48538:1130-1399(+)